MWIFESCNNQRINIEPISWNASGTQVNWERFLKFPKTIFPIYNYKPFTLNSKSKDKFNNGTKNRSIRLDDKIQFLLFQISFPFKNSLGIDTSPTIDTVSILLPANKRSLSDSRDRRVQRLSPVHCVRQHWHFLARCATGKKDRLAERARELSNRRAYYKRESSWET